MSTVRINISDETPSPPDRVAQMRSEASDAARRGDYELARALWADAAEIEAAR